MRALAVGAALLALCVTACDAQPTEVTLVPTTGTATITTGGASDDDGSGNTTPDEQLDSCSTIARTYFDAVGAEGRAAALRPLYDAVTPLLPEGDQAAWQLAADAFIAYEDAIAEVAPGDDVLAEPAAREAYERATSDEVQAAIQQVRDAIERSCPGTFG